MKDKNLVPLMSVPELTKEINKKPKQMNEHYIQKAIFDIVLGKIVFGKAGQRSGFGLCKQCPQLLLMYAVPNASKRSRREAMFMIAEGMRSGVPDICLPYNNGKWNNLYIETKTPKGKLTEAQTWWHNELKKYNNLVKIVRSATEGVQILIDYVEGKI